MGRDASGSAVPNPMSAVPGARRVYFTVYTFYRYGGAGVPVLSMAPVSSGSTMRTYTRQLA